MQNEKTMKTERIIQWRESMETLPAQTFFPLMRTYLGEIQTPFNKHKLIERLSSVLRNEENRRTIGSLLSERDIKILTALTLLRTATRHSLENFFEGEYPPRELWTAALNLTDRLIIYFYQEDLSGSSLRLNPLLEDTIGPFIDIRTVLPPPVIAQPADFAPPPLSPLFFAAFFSYVRSSPDLCKVKTGLKKKDTLRLEKLFPAQQERLELLLGACLNLEIFRRGERGIFIDEAKLAAFADLNESDRLAFLSIAAAARFRRDHIRIYAQQLLNTAASIPPEGLTRQSIKRIWFVQSEQQEDFKAHAACSRFTQLITTELAEEDMQDFNPENYTDKVLDAAHAFGLFEEKGRTADGTSVFVRSAAACAAESPPIDEAQLRKAVSATAANTVTVFPVLPLPELLELALFMDCTAFGTAAEFEINKKSACRAFDHNLTPEHLCTRLERFCAYPLPQSLKANFDEWYAAYTSAILYKGYVLKTNERISRLIEKTSELSACVQCRLSDGVYFLNIPLNTDAAHVLSRAGLSMTAGIQQAVPEPIAVTFPALAAGKNQLAEFSRAPSAHEDPDQCAEIQRNFSEILAGLELDDAERKCLAGRIARKIVINPTQLSAATMKLENLEADGTEYFKKLRLLEDAVGTGDIAEVLVPISGTIGMGMTYFGTVQGVTRDEADATLTLQMDSTHEARIFSVSKLTHVKIIRKFQI